jgi:hypothetical protein
METVCHCQRQKEHCGRICPVATNARKSGRHNARPGPKKYGKEWSLTWSRIFVFSVPVVSYFDFTT